VPIITKQNVITRAGSAPGLEVSDLVDAAQGSQSLRMGELTMAPNTRVPRHIHPNTEEAMLILEGTLDVILGDQRMTVGPGDVVLAPAGTVHGFLNRTQAPARLLFVFPTHQVGRVLVSVSGATVGFPSEQGLTGYASPQDRPLERHT
jgi:quercetin dioxygenase-like cupin family protein